MKRLPEALVSVDRALALRPHYGQALHNRGIVLQKFGRLEEALASFERALAMQPDLPYAFSSAAQCVLNLSDWDRLPDSPVPSRSTCARASRPWCTLPDARLQRRPCPSAALRRDLCRRLFAVPRRPVRDDRTGATTASAWPTVGGFPAHATAFPAHGRALRTPRPRPLRGDRHILRPDDGSECAQRLVAAFDGSMMAATDDEAPWPALLPS